MSLYLCSNLNASFRNFKEKNAYFVGFVNIFFMNYIMLAEHFSCLVKISLVIVSIF